MSLLNFLNLAELGISTAIGYVLYKPIFEHDETRINEIISVLGYMYRWIGRIIIAAGVALSCFLPVIFPSTGFSYGIIYFAYYSFLASSLIGYFANYRQTLLGADQRNYVVAFYFQTASIIKIICQMLSAWYTGSYYLWIGIELFFGIIYSFILNWKINQVYPWLKSNVALGKELFKNILKSLNTPSSCLCIGWEAFPVPGDAVPGICLCFPPDGGLFRQLFHRCGETAPSGQ